jgi:hypothetical protein
MKHADYVYTRGIDEEEVERRLRERSHAALALARENDVRGPPQLPLRR